MPWGDKYVPSYRSTEPGQLWRALMHGGKPILHETASQALSAARTHVMRGQGVKSEQKPVDDMGLGSFLKRRTEKQLLDREEVFGVINQSGRQVVVETRKRKRAVATA